MFWGKDLSQSESFWNPGKVPFRFTPSLVLKLSLNADSFVLKNARKSLLFDMTDCAPILALMKRLWAIREWANLVFFSSRFSKYSVITLTITYFLFTFSSRTWFLQSLTGWFIYHMLCYYRCPRSDADTARGRPLAPRIPWTRDVPTLT